MERRRLEPRRDWRRKVEDQGLTWHTTDDGRPYWDESAYWAFTADEVDRIEAATAELYDMVLAAVADAVENRRLAAFGYSGAAAEVIERSWKNREWEPTLYARFDMAYDGRDLKMLELNGDTPTSLVEAAVVQWFWLEERFPNADQFNSIHDRLVDAFKLYAQHGGRNAPLHLTSVAPHAEDEGTIAYLAACAGEAGLAPTVLPIDRIGWREGGGVPGHFVDEADRPIRALFKLYPWEWLLDEQFGQALAEEVLAGRLTLMEPAWKAVASNKRLLVTLKEFYPDSELLLDASTSAADAARWGGEFVRKPVRGREGQNVTLMRPTGRGAAEEIARRDGTYGDDLFVFQRKAELAQTGEGGVAVIGSWMVNRQACGMGIRESDGPITDDKARFVPHVME